MKVRHWSGECADIPISEIVKYEVEATSSGYGELEDMQKRVQVLTGIVAALLQHLGDGAAQAVVGGVGFYHTLPSEDD